MMTLPPLCFGTVLLTHPRKLTLVENANTVEHRHPPPRKREREKKNPSNNSRTGSMDPTLQYLLETNLQQQVVTQSLCMVT